MMKQAFRFHGHRSFALPDGLYGKIVRMSVLRHTISIVSCHLRSRESTGKTSNIMSDDVTTDDQFNRPYVGKEFCWDLTYRGKFTKKGPIRK